MENENKRSRCYVHVSFKTNDQTNRYDSKTYVYLAEGTVEENEKYEYAVVVSPYSGLVVVKVNAVTLLDESDYNGKCKYIVQFVDMTDHDERLAAEKRRAAILKELERIASERSEEERLAKLLAGDANAEKLLAELRTLK